MAVTTTRRPARRHPGSPVPDYVVREVGPLQCRFVADRALPDDKRPGQAPPIPTVDSLVALAWRLLPAKADTLATDPDYRQKILAAKPTRDAAATVVRLAHLRNPAGEAYTVRELAPLITAVRKQLVTMVREHFKQSDRRTREHLRRACAATRQADRQLVKLVEKFRTAPTDATQQALLGAVDAYYEAFYDERGWQQTLGGRG